MELENTKRAVDGRGTEVCVLFKSSWTQPRPTGCEAGARRRVLWQVQLRFRASLTQGTSTLLQKLYTVCMTLVSCGRAPFFDNTTKIVALSGIQLSR